MGTEVIEVSDADFAEKVEQSSKPVLVDFWAEWCGPCRAMAPVLDDFASEYGEKITVAKLNVDSSPSTAQRFQVMSIPTMLLFEGGQPKKQLVGAMPKEHLAAELGEWA